MTDNTLDLNQDQQPEQAEEVKNPAAVLKKNKDLLTRNATQAAHIAEQAARITELEEQLRRVAEDNEMRSKDFAEFHIRRPMARLAEEISSLPDIWMTEFSKHFDVRAVENDDLGIFDKEGKRCVVPKGFKGEGDPVKFTADGIWWMLCSDLVGGGSTPEAKRWGAMMRWFGPSGSGATGSSGSHSAPSKPRTPPVVTPPAYGIR